MRKRTTPDGQPPVRWGDSGPFAVVPLWIVRSGLSDKAVRVYALLAGFAGSPEAATFRGKVELAEILGCAKSTIEKALGELSEAGAITVEERRSDTGSRLSNSYIVHAAPNGGGVPKNREGGPGQSGGGSPGESGSLRARGSSLEPLDPVEGEEPFAAVPAARVGPPPLAKVDGRNVVMDAVAAECGVAKGSPRFREVVVAVQGSRGSPGIRRLAWVELGEPAAGGEEFERAVARLVVERAATYRRRMKGAMLTPPALAKWWVDVLNVEAGDRIDALDAAHVAADEARRMGL